MAIVLPVMMLVITGIVSFGLLLSSYLIVSHAVDVGARNLALSRGASTRALSKRISSQLERFFQSEGQALVETALILPIVMIIVMGILVFGIFTMQIMSLTQGVSNAGRVLAVSSGQTTDPCSLAATSVQNAAPLLSKSSLTYSITLTPTVGGISHNYSQASCPSTSTTTGAAGYLVSGGTVSVTASYSNCSLKFYGKNFLPNGCSISNTITEAVQ
jgi:Flp pilus assembly protein TadG